ncbi:MAG: hypothetical protein FWE87_03835, partial [Coriobacteriia bacterium]|nr:hypothetical protein [Coriobacteriia bacterium]
KEPILFVANQLLLYAFLLPLFDLVRGSLEKFIILLLGIPSIFIILRFSYVPSSFATLLVDFLIVLEVGYGLYIITCYALSIKMKAAILGLLAAVLAVQKITTPFLIVMLAIAVCAQLFFEYRDNQPNDLSRYGWRECMLLISALAIPALVTYIAWEVVVSVYA